MRRTLVFLLFLCLVRPATPWAQQIGPVAEGARVRIVAPESRGTFLVTGLASDTLVLRADQGEEFRLSTADLQRLEVSRGQRSRGAGALRGGALGGLLGGATGAMVGLASGDDTCQPGDWCLFALSAGEKAGLLAGFFGGVGALAGAVWGAARPGTRWDRVPLPLHAVAGAEGGGALELSVSFRF